MFALHYHSHEFLSITYLHYTFLPATDHFLFANLEPEGLVTVTGRVKLASVGEGACREETPVIPLEALTNHQMGLCHCHPLLFEVLV